MRKLEQLILKALDNEIIANIVRVFILVIMPIIIMFVTNIILTYIDKM